MLSKALKSRIVAHSRPFSSYLVTTPIFYVNANPHIGHLYSVTLAEGIANVLRMQGKKAYFMTGTDEHGLKIQQMAQSQGLTPQQLTNKQSQVFRDLFSLSKIQYDVFIRTQEQRHKEVVREMWSRLADQGKIVMGKHAGYYCTNEESFIPEKELIVKEGRRFTALGHEAEYVEEDNFQLLFDEKCQTFVKQWLRNEKSIIPRNLATDLESRTSKVGSKLSVSRPAARVDWGIRVPGHSEHTIYVWFDALFNYLTVSRGLEAKEPLKMIHLIGKDIATFHCVYWPGYLHSLGLEPPESVVIHGHWLKSGKKMSKSLGNVVDPFELVKKHGSDAFKLYFLTHGPLRADANFDEREMVELYNDFVVGAYSKLSLSLVNILFRLIGKKPIIFELAGSSLNPEQEQLSAQVKGIVRETRDILTNDYDFVNGYVALRKGADLINRYINQTQFWKEKDEQRLKVFKFAVIRCFLQLSVGVQFFIPRLATTVLNHFQVAIQQKEGEDTVQTQLQEITNKSAFSVDPKAIRTECYVQRLTMEQE